MEIEKQYIWDIPLVEKKLKEKGLRPSVQRIKVLKFLLENKIHPTVDEIYENLKGEIPTLSKTTVYNTLKLFLEKGLIKLVTIELNETRYDADLSLHGHFKCEVCGKIYDFEIKKIEIEKLDNFVIKNKNLELTGICKSCLQKGATLEKH
jgi:Fe2+ or Zn2+ uptake regulation protein